MVYSTAEILPFYGHNTKQQYCEFSNFYWHDTAFRFVMPDFAKQSWTPPEIDCHFSEKAIMAIKASLFDDAETFKLIDAAVTPSETKALGRMVKNFNEELWSKHLDQTAFEVVFQKFNSSKRLRELLLKTGKTLIVEAAPNDRIWGVGIAKSDRRIWDPKQWEGKNVLGKALMQARDRLMGGPAEAAPEPQRIDSAGASEATTAAPDPKRGRWQKSEAAKAKAKVACDKQRDIKTLLTQSQESPECASDYDCYVVLDFEATCWEGRHADQEIIEFPLVLVDAKTLTQVDEFRTYVRPEQNPTLSQFCTKLTGITQEQVSEAPTWPTAREVAKAWLDDRLSGHGYRRWLLVTCGDWDLKTMLPMQCKLAGEPVPAPFQTWLNIKRLFSEVTGEKATGMEGMLEVLHLELEGRHHCGLDDCKNIARILEELLKRGGTIKEELLWPRTGGYKGSGR